MALDIERVRGYGKIDDETDQTVEDLLEAAKAYVTNALEVKDPAVLEADPLYDLCVKMLVSHWHDNRGAVITGASVSDIPIGVKSLISQLSNKEWPEEGSSS